MKITKKNVESLLPKDKPYFEWDTGDGALKGFGVAVHPTGRKVFVAQFRIGAGRAAKERRSTIGPFGTWTVEQARVRASELIREGQTGIDRKANVAAEREAVRTALAAENKERRLVRELRIDRLAARFMRDHVKVKRKAATDDFYRHIILRYIFPAFKNRDARTITRGEVNKLHVSLAAKPATANRVVTVLSAIYGFAEQMELLPDNIRRPTYRIEKYKEQSKERFLDVAELQRLGSAIRDAETTDRKSVV